MSVGSDAGKHSRQICCLTAAGLVQASLKQVGKAVTAHSRRQLQQYLVVRAELGCCCRRCAAL